MKLFFWSLALSASLVVGQITPGSGIDASNPCVAANFTNGLGELVRLRHAALYTQADVDAISVCENFTGNIWISSQFPGEVFLPKLKILSGHLDAGSKLNYSGEDTLSRIDLSSLQVVMDDRGLAETSVDVQNITSLETIWLPSMRKYSHTLNFQNLPRLTNIYIGNYTNTTQMSTYINYQAKISINASEALFVDLVSSEEVLSMSAVINSAGVATFSLDAPTVYSLVVNASDIRFTSPISFGHKLELSGCDSQSGEVVFIYDSYKLINSSLSTANVTLPDTGELVIENNPELTKVSFASSNDSLSNGRVLGASLNSMRISNCTSLPQISLAGAGLEALGDYFYDHNSHRGHLNITDNAALSSIDFPDLQNVIGSIHITNCTNLSSISFPKLTTIRGDIFLVGNDKLSVITGFPQLSSIEGSVDLRGTFSNVTLPRLAEVVRNFNINSTISANYCEVFDKYRDELNYYDDPYISGNYSCVDPSRPKTKTLRKPRRPPYAPKQGLSSGEKAGIAIGSVVVFILVLWFTSWLVQRKDTLNPPVETQPQVQSTATNIPTGEISRNDRSSRELETNEPPSDPDAIEITPIPESSRPSHIPETSRV